MTNYDYSALDLLAVKTSALKSSRFLIFAGGGIVGIVFTALFNRELAISLIPLYIAGFGVSFYLYELNRKRTSEAESAAFAQFATANGLAYTPSGPAVSAEPGTLFRFGDTPKTRDLFSGRAKEFPFRLFTYTYMSGSGKSRAEHEQAVMVVDLPHAIPHLVIDSLVEPGTNNISVLPIEFSADQRLKLEGDFENYFAVYSPEGQGVSALTLLAPDVMQTIMHRAAYCDIEFVQNRLYMYWPGLPKTADNFRQIFDTLQAILDEVGAKLRSAKALDAGPATHLSVAPANPPLLKRSAPKFVAVIIATMSSLFVLMMIGGMVSPELAGWAGYLTHGAFVFVYVYIFWMYKKKYKAQAHYEKYYGKTPQA